MVYWIAVPVGIYLLVPLIIWLGFFKSPVRVIHSPWSANVPSRNKETRNQTLVELLQQKVPSIFGPDAHFKPARWLRGGHLQTMYCSIGDFTRTDPVEYQRQFIRVPEGGVLALDIFPSLDAQPATTGEKVIVVMHGLTGGSHESYVRAALYDVTKPILEGGLGMRAVVMNFRGCAGSPVVTRRLYHAGETEDLRATMLYLTNNLFKEAQFFGMGFSLGANAMTKYCGEEAENCPFAAAVSIANIWDFVKGDYYIKDGTYLNRHVYDYVLGGALQSLLKMHQDAFPEDIPGKPHVEVQKVLNSKGVTLRIYNEYITSPTFGFDGATDHYAQISSTRFVDHVRVPLLALNACNDPIVSEENHPDCQIYASPWVVLARTGGGGHMGWFERGGTRWFVKPMHQFLEAMIHADLEKRPIPKALPPDEKGMICQEGRPDIGYIVVEPNDIHVTSGNGKSKLFSGW